MLRFRFDTPQIDGQIHPDARLVGVISSGHRDGGAAWTLHGEVVDNARLLIEAGRASGFRCIAHAQRAIHPVKRSMIGPARRARIEHIVLLVRGK